MCPARFWDLYPASEIKVPANQYPPKDMPDVAWQSSWELVAYPDIKSLGFDGAPNHVMDPEDSKALRRAYYACVSHVDEELGRVLDTLDQSSFAADTVISLVGDHGWQLGEHGMWSKHTNFDLATNTPMLIRVPGLSDQGRESSQYAELLDLLPTLADATLGEKIPACSGDSSSTQLCTDGTSLVPLLAGTPADTDSVLVKDAAYSQFDRCVGECGGVEGKKKADAMGLSQMSACRSRPCTMYGFCP